ncbi:endolytic transglycosylase MltG [Helicobacter sp. MIT 00-7814]|uniref:endolytic transglycosylase MltG n=1 Tax=unclassified Helicobacter TaxID=2593540 RepID=UPI000E1ED15D|nr:MULTISPECIES: endolytic transglycosylase MltG [unclassified Helicobacter]RDU55000.1 endolytic transglycosylase MltG [Helicobacter sp. MIT 00-7814]RDU55969.1 endolytic transglycosylase MltG [Helicobacter sp. MIT 99-10781]
MSYLRAPVQMPQVLNVPKGSIKSIITYLNTIDDTQDKQFGKVDEWLMRLFWQPQSGVIALDSATTTTKDTKSAQSENLTKDTILTKGAFLRYLSTAKSATKEITLIPGETLHFFIQDLAQKFELDPQKLQNAYEKYFDLPDGVIVAETYKLPLGLNEDSLMKLLAQLSYSWHEKQAITLLGKYDKEAWFYLVRKASIVQKEAANKEEMPIVAAVIENRLKLNMPLQMDGSLNYGAFSHTKVTPERIRNDTSAYNTYKYKGIPSYPSGSVSIDSLKAVIAPADVDYLYFVRNPNGTHTFTKTYQEHKSNF